MVNNEFRLIGTVLTPFEKVQNASVDVYTFSIEVDEGKTGTKRFMVHVFADNKGIDFNGSLKGCIVAVSGEMKVKFNGKYQNLSLTARNISILTKASWSTRNSYSNAQKDENKPTEPAKKVEKKPSTEHQMDMAEAGAFDHKEEPTEVSDEDLPF